MKKILFSFAAVVLFAGLASAQVSGPVVTSASFLQWDYSTSVTGMKEFRVYLSRTPAVVPTATPTATVAFPTLQWPISAATGQWYAVVTAVTTGDVESTPSNEVPFFVLEKPANLRVKPD